jgi:peroxiredoxin Q/BCP
MLAVGQSFPDFNLQNQDHEPMSLRDFRGKWVVLFVYPKDDTPGCTLEGKSFSAAKEQFTQVGAVAIGLSEDDAESHKNFCTKHGFTVPLLADPKAELLKQAGVTQSEHKGVMYWDRTTFLIDPSGLVRKVYEKVKPEGHEKQVLEDIKRLQSH